MREIEFTLAGCLLVALILLLAPSAEAVSHDHHMGAHVNSFSKGKPMHCILSGHSQGKPCPHILNPVNSTRAVLIRSDCGGVPDSSNTINLVSGQKSPLTNGIPGLDIFRSAAPVFSSNHFYASLFHPSIDHPPRPL